MNVKVWNKNPHVDIWREKFKGDWVEIKRGTPKIMELYEATEFKGQFYPPKILPDETQDPKSFKMIEVEKPGQDEIDAENEGMEVFPCNACKKVFTTEDMLTKHADALHADRVIVDPEIEREIMRKRGRPAKTDTKTETA